MKGPKPLPAVVRYGRNSVSSIASAGVSPSMIASKTVGKQPTPACRLLGEYGCK